MKRVLRWANQDARGSMNFWGYFIFTGMMCSHCLKHWTHWTLLACFQRDRFLYYINSLQHEVRQPTLYPTPSHSVSPMTSRGIGDIGSPANSLPVAAPSSSAHHYPPVSDYPMSSSSFSFTPFQAFGGATASPASSLSVATTSESSSVHHCPPVSDNLTSFPSFPFTLLQASGHGIALPASSLPVATPFSSACYHLPVSDYLTLSSSSLCASLQAFGNGIASPACSLCISIPPTPVHHHPSVSDYTISLYSFSFTSL